MLAAAVQGMRAQGVQGAQGTQAGQGSRPVVSAAFDRDSILIGDQFHLDVEVEKDLMQVVEFPVLTGAAIDANVEILTEYEPDTVSTQGRRQTIRKRYLLTIFNEGQYNIGRFPVMYADKNIVDTLYSRDTLRMKVATFDINLETDKPFDIKPPRRFPLKFGEISGWLALSVLGVGLIVFLIWLFVRYRKRIPFLGGQRPQIPPHLLAIRKLEALRNQKLPQNGNHKQYYSGLTDILREYLYGRFGIPAMEMTTDEIMAAVAAPKKEGLIDERRYGDLRELLWTADLVKFAKYTPDEDYDDTAYYNAYYFIEETKPVDEEGKPKEAEQDPLKTT